jgi:hypothetical protein
LSAIASFSTATERTFTFAGSSARRAAGFRLSLLKLSVLFSYSAMRTFVTVMKSASAEVRPPAPHFSGRYRIDEYVGSFPVPARIRRGGL